MIGKAIGYRDFPDGVLQIIYEDSHGQYIVNDDGQRAYGVWFVQEKGAFPLPLPINWTSDMILIKRG
jgi:hypothetical protein